jgi:thymidylate synthase
VIHFDDIEEGWPLLLKYVLSSGRVAVPRGYPTREVGPIMFKLHDPSRAILHSSARKLNHAFSAVEFLWVASGQDEADVLGFFNSKMLDFADQPKVSGSEVDGYTETPNARLFGAYGPPIVAQLPYILENLKEPDSRQAVITIWRQNPPRTRDVPCTVALQFILRDGRLSLFTTMRSNDLFLGVPYDVPLFCRVLYYVASLLGVDVGEYYHAAGSLHLYERDLDAVRPALSPHHIGVRPKELEIGRFDANVHPLRVWGRVADEVRYNARQVPMQPCEGWSTLAMLAEEYIYRKREREAAGG